MHMTGLCFASSSLGAGNCVCEGGGSVLLFNVHNRDLFPPSGDSPSPLAFSQSERGLSEAGQGWLGRWGADELEEPGQVEGNGQSHRQELRG